jgi:hypothetical protein
MSRRPDVVTPRLRFALAITVGGMVAVLTPSLLATTVDAPAVVLAALMVALAAAAGLNHHVATFATLAMASPPRASNDVPVYLAGRVTDPVHHPIRPRAPGMA